MLYKVIRRNLAQGKSQMEARRLSSIVTFFGKFVAPTAFFLGATASFLMSWYGDVENNRLTSYFLLAMFFSSLMDADKKAVKTDGKFFTVSNYIRSERVPCAALRDVYYRKNVRGITITLMFEPQTTFGNKINIICPLDFRNVFSMLVECVRRNKSEP